VATGAPAPIDARPANPQREAQARRFAGLERRAQGRLALLLLPAVVFLLVLYGYPVAAMLVRAFNDPQWGWHNFAPLIQARSTLDLLVVQIPSNAYVRVLGITLQIALGVTFTTLLLGYLVAYALASLPARWANLLMIFVLVPFWTSILVRSYAWMVLLGREGLVNQALVGMGLTPEPVQLLNTRFAVYVGMVHVLLPFMILPLYAVMRGIDRNLLRAAENLGARPSQVFRAVFLPLSLPGVAAGCLLVFILALGFYITPALLGGQRDVMVSMLIQQQVTQLKWGVASALALVLLALSLGIYVLFTRLLGVQRLFGGARA
jgi:putative spermidine/putrescine transport system permease protein